MQRNIELQNHVNPPMMLLPPESCDKLTVEHVRQIGRLHLAKFPPRKNQGVVSKVFTFFCCYYDGMEVEQYDRLIHIAQAASTWNPKSFSPRDGWIYLNNLAFDRNYSIDGKRELMSKLCVEYIKVLGQEIYENDYRINNFREHYFKLIQSLIDTKLPEPACTSPSPNKR